MRPLIEYMAALHGEQRLDGIVCVAPDLSSVFQVVQDGERQEGTIALVGSHGGGRTTLVPIPQAFVVAQIDLDGPHFAVTSIDGRQIRATPQQFANVPVLIDARFNQAHEEQLLEQWMSTADRPDAAATIEWQTVQAGQFKIRLGFDCADAESNMPKAERILAHFDEVHAAAVDFLGADGEGRSPGTLVVYRTGDFALHFDNTETNDEAAWPAVQFQADLTPVQVTIEA
jgi:hypothetical protein